MGKVVAQRRNYGATEGETIYRGTFVRQEKRCEKFCSNPKQPLSLQGRTTNKRFHFKIIIEKREQTPSKTESSRRS